MTNYLFYLNVFLANISLYFCSLFISTVFWYPIIRRIIKSVFDPLFLILCFSVIANSIPIFLFLTDNMNTDKFLYFCLSEFLFWIGYFMCEKKHVCFAPYIIQKDKVCDLCFYFFFLIYIGSTLFTYILLGVPLFMVSRLETYSNSGGLGLLGQMIGFSSFYCIVYSFYLYFNKPSRKTIAVITLLLSILFNLLSGSKSSVLIVLTGYFIYKYYYEESTINVKMILKYIPFFILFPLIVIMFQSGGNIYQAIGSFFFRLMANGDVYWLGFSNDVIDKIEIKDDLLYLFSRVLAPFRIIDYSSVEQPIGVQLNWLVVPDDIGIIKGPNTRITVLGWVLYRWGGLVLSFIVGVICAFWRTRVLQYFPKGIITVIFYGYIYFSFCSMFTDPMLGMGSVFSIVLFSALLYVFYLVIGGRFIKIKHI